MRSTSCNGRPLHTRIPGALLAALAAVSIAAACAIGIAVAVAHALAARASSPSARFIVVAYNLELFGGAFHADLWFAAAWGAFPVLTAYFASAETPARRGRRRRRVTRSLTSLAQRRLSTPASGGTVAEEAAPDDVTDVRSTRTRPAETSAQAARRSDGR